MSSILRRFLRAATDRFTRATSTPPEEPKGLVARRPGERLDVAEHPLALPGLLAQVVAQPGAQVQHLLVARHPEAFLGGPAGLHLRHVRRGSGWRSRRAPDPNSRGSPAPARGSPAPARGSQAPARGSQAPWRRAAVAATRQRMGLRPWARPRIVTE